jgi:3-hydroxybutyryl-CoA dehydrogenase
MSEIIGVVGSGTMGNGIAQVAARAGYTVILCDVQDEFLQRGMSAIDKSLQRDVDKQRLTGEEKGAIVGRIQTATELDALSDASFVIEAVTEDLNVKTELFKSLDRITPLATILASNTSSISITKLGATTNRPDKVIGMHFMNPVPVMKLVEVIRGIATSNETYDKVRALTEKLGKTALDCNDSPGFVSNDQRSDFHSLRRRGYARKHRRDHETRHESSDGSARAGRLHWSRRLSGNT